MKASTFPWCHGFSTGCHRKVPFPSTELPFWERSTARRLGSGLAQPPFPRCSSKHFDLSQIILDGKRSQILIEALPFFFFFFLKGSGRGYPFVEHGSLCSLGWGRVQRCLGRSLLWSERCSFPHFFFFFFFFVKRGLNRKLMLSLSFFRGRPACYQNLRQVRQSGKVS